MTMLNRILLTLSMLIVELTLSGQNWPGVTQVNVKEIVSSTITIAPDARASGIGDAGGALSPDAASFYWNTAKLGFARDRAMFGFSYVPWLRQLFSDMNMLYGSGCVKLGQKRNHVVGGSVRYFTHGNISVINTGGAVLGSHHSEEYEFLGGYAYRFSKRNSLGVNAKFIYSDITGGFVIGGVKTHPGLAGAIDISFAHVNDQFVVFRRKAVWSFTTTIANLGNKISYGLPDDENFLPATLRIATTLKAGVAKFHSVTGCLNVNKFMVPQGNNTDMSVPLSIIRSFYDDPGQVSVTSSGATVVRGRALGEFRQFIFSGGLEYWYRDILSARAGYHHEHITQGYRKFLTFGLGARFRGLGFDFSYLCAFKRQNPLANSVHFTLTMNFGRGNGPMT